MIDLETKEFPAAVDETAGMDADELAGWLDAHAPDVERALGARGAILFRGGRMRGAGAFEQVCRALTPCLSQYIGGGSPRTELGGNIYTSTEYSHRVPIPLHCEASYLPDMPSRLWFFCQCPPGAGGQTPLADMTRFGEDDPRRIIDGFRERGVTYIMNLHGGEGFGKSWAETYQTRNRDRVEEILRSLDATFCWTDDGGLGVIYRSPGTAIHPDTGAEVWINQAVAWHPAHLGMDRYEQLLRYFGDEMNFPKTAMYGDGSPIDPADILALTAMLTRRETTFDWREGDLLLLDNLRIAHGRRPFEGPREIHVAMA